MWITDCVLDGNNEAADCFRGCIDLLDSIPAADVVPVVHGEPTEHLRELLRAEKDGRLVVLPCKAGDELWSFSTYPAARVYGFTVTDISTLNGRTVLNTLGCGTLWERDIGKTVFLTREEAEKALEARENG
jgi:hypothetical protein